MPENISNISLVKAEEQHAGRWPKEALLSDTRLFFSLNWLPSHLLSGLARHSAARILDLIFITSGFLGLLALLLHLVVPAGNLWLNIFLLAMLALLIYWTRIARRAKAAKRRGSDIDVKLYFTHESLEIFHKTLLGRGERQATPARLLLHLLKNPGVQAVFYRLGHGYRQLSMALGPILESSNQSQPAIDENLADIPFLAYEIKEATGAEFITPPILVAAIAKLEQNTTTGQFLAELEIEYADIYAVVKWQTVLEQLDRQRSHEYAFFSLKPKSEINRSMTSLPTPVLNRFGTDITLRARLGRLPHVVGRQEELAKILSAFTSNRSAVLIVGEHGVGKTSLIELLAQRMLTENVPPRLFDKRLVRLELPQILGEKEGAGQALTAAINDALRGGDIVLVVENVHEFAQSSASGVALLSILTAALSDHDLPLICTTTPQEYQQTPALSNNFFERIDIAEISREDTLLIACVHASILENQFGIFWTFAAVKKAVALSSRYIAEGRQPEKSIKVLEILAERQKGGRGKSIAIISEHDVEALVSEIAHVDAQAVGSNEADKLLHLEEKLHEKVIGQDEAVRAIATAMRRIKAGLADVGHRPLASFLFIGPTGVGKTELAKQLAAIEFGTESAMVRLDMSEYNLAESVEKLLGGRTFASQFAVQVREHPYSVILLDEFEKSHPDVQNIFLQVMDEGVLTDNSGSKLDLSNTIIIATSNAASQEIGKGYASGLEHKALLNRLMHGALPHYFKPELLNRFDDVILFKALEIKEVAQIAQLQIQRIIGSLQEKGITLSATPEGLMKIAESGYDAVYGARPLKRYLQDTIENQIADWILSGELQRRDTVVITPDGTARIQKATPLAG